MAYRTLWAPCKEHECLGAYSLWKHIFQQTFAKVAQELETFVISTNGPDLKSSAQWN